MDRLAGREGGVGYTLCFVYIYITLACVRACVCVSVCMRTFVARHIRQFFSPVQPFAAVKHFELFYVALALAAELATASAANFCKKSQKSNPQNKTKEYPKKAKEFEIKSAIQVKITIKYTKRTSLKILV